MNRYLYIFFYLIFCLCFTTCTNKKDLNTGINSNNIISGDSSVKKLAEEKQWLNFYKLGEIGSDKIFYRRNDSLDNVVGFFNLKNNKYSEMHISNELTRFFPRRMWLYRLFTNKESELMVFEAFGKENNKLITVYFHNTVNDSISYITFNGEIVHNYEKTSNKSNDYVWVKGIKVKLDNIRMELIAYINDEGVNPYELKGEKGELYGVRSEISTEKGRKSIVDRIRKDIMDRSINSAVKKHYNSIPSVSDYIAYGKDNALRFNNQFRGKIIEFYGKVDDLDEPWGTKYKYRLKLNDSFLNGGCYALTNDNFVLNLNKGDNVYLTGTCADFNSNSYRMEVVDVEVLSEEHVKERVRKEYSEMRPDNRLIGIGDYNLYYEDVLSIISNPQLENSDSLVY